MSPHTGRRVLALRFILRTILAPTAIGLTVYYLASRFSLPHKPLLVACSVVVGWPIKFSLGARYKGWRRTRRARALGAVPAFESRWKLLGDTDVVQEVRKTDMTRFSGKSVRFVRNPRIALVEPNCLVGEWFAAQYEKVGSGTFGAVLVGEYLISTSDPGNVKMLLATEFNNFEKGT